jgi:hypothetical protein
MEAPRKEWLFLSWDKWNPHKEGVMVWIWSVLQKGSRVEGLVPNAAMFRGGVWQKRLDHKCSDFINGLIPWWIHNMMTLLGGSTGRRWALVGGSKSLWPCIRRIVSCLWPLPLYFLLCFLGAMKWATYFCHSDTLPQARPRAIGSNVFMCQVLCATFL